MLRTVTRARVATPLNVVAGSWKLACAMLIGGRGGYFPPLIRHSLGYGTHERDMRVGIKLVQSARENAALSIVCHRCTTFSAGRRDSLRWPLNRPATTRPAAGNAWGPAPCEARRRARQQPPHHAIAPAVAQPYGRSSAQPHSARRHASRAAPHLGEHATARLRRAHLPQNAAPPARHAPLAARKTLTCRLPLCLTHCH